MGSRSNIFDNGFWWMAGFLGAVFFLTHLWNLNSRFVEFRWDGLALGHASHLLWNLAHGLEPESASGAALSWFEIPAVLYLLAPFYKLWPNPFFLVTIQTTALAAAAGAVFILGRHYLTRLRALILTLLFCFYPPIFGMSSASFHPAVLAVPFLTLLILSAVRGRGTAIAVFAVCALFCDLRAGLLMLPLLLRQALVCGRLGWWIAAAAAATAGLAGFFWTRHLEEGMGPFIFYGALTAPYLMWALFTFEKWTDRALKKRSLVLAAVSPVFFAGVVFASALMGPAILDSHPGVSQLSVRKSAVNALIERIPASAEVWTTPLFLPRFSNRSNVALLDGRTAVPAGSGARRYALADLGGSTETAGPDERVIESLRDLVRRGWGPIASAGSVILFSEQPGSRLQPLYAPVDPAIDAPFLTLRAMTDGPIEMTGFTMTPDPGDSDLIRFSFYWKKIESSSVDYAVQMTVVDSDGTTVYSAQRGLCYGLHPFVDWKVGETIRDEFLFVVPEHLKHSSYEVRLALRRLPGFESLPMRSLVGGASDKDGRIRLIALDAI